MTQKKQFYNRLKYAPYKFKHANTSVAAHRHTNPDGSEGGWVAETAIVEDTVHMDPDTEVFEWAHVKGNVQILHEAYICEFAIVQGDAVIDDYSMVAGSALIGGNAYIGGQSIIAGDSEIGGYNEVISEIVE